MTLGHEDRHTYFRNEIKSTDGKRERDVEEAGVTIREDAAEAEEAGIVARLEQSRRNTKQSLGGHHRKNLVQ